MLEAGIDHVELSSCHRHEDGTVDFLKGSGARLLVHGYFPPPADPFIFNLSSPRASIRRRSIDLALEAIDTCLRLSCPVYTFHGGYLSDPDLSFRFGATGRIDREEGLALFFESLEEIRGYARRAGIALAVENNPCMPGLEGLLLFDAIADFEAMFAEPALGGVQVLLDMGHLRVSSNVLGFDADRFIETVRPRTRVLHVNSNDGEVDSHGGFEEDSWCVRMLRKHGLGNRDMVLELNGAGTGEITRCAGILARLEAR